MPKKPKLFIGLMSGTSMDGVDAALLEIAGAGRQTRLRLVHFVSIPFDPPVRQKLLHVASGNPVSAQVISHLNFLLGEAYTETVTKLCEEAHVSFRQIDAIGCHGQTIFHQSEPGEFCGRPMVSTLQIGEASLIAEQTGVTTVCDFRPRDMAAGGKGAPLIPYVDYLLFRHARKGRILLNLGGIANLTVLSAGARLANVTAFDTGPGNMVIDALVRKATRNQKNFDRNGDLARRGRVLPTVLKKLMQHPYFGFAPPKTAGREQFGDEFVDHLIQIADGAGSEDLICTATELTAQSIAQAIERFVIQRTPIRELIVSGGGSKNRYMGERLKAALPRLVVLESDAVGVPSLAKEAIGFALLANETLHLKPSNVPSATGARHEVILGKVVYGKNYKRTWRCPTP
ncbi:MAG: anhydro-N-acetylmuramic acid kinase [Terriglobia bacterium]